MTLMKTTNHYVVKFNMSFFLFPVFFFLFASSSSSYSLILYRFSALTRHHLFLLFIFFYSEEINFVITVYNFKSPV